MDIEDFFKLDKPIQRIHVPMGASRSRPMPPKKNVYPDSTVPRGGYEYAKDYQKIEEEHYLKVPLPLFVNLLCICCNTFQLRIILFNKYLYQYFNYSFVSDFV